MYAIRLKPGTDLTPLAAGTYVACGPLPSEIRFTPNIQAARTWESYREAYSYVDENLYGIADVVTVVSMHSLLTTIKRIGNNVVTQTMPQLCFDQLDKKPASNEPSFSPQEPQPTTHQDSKVQPPQVADANYDSSLPMSDGILHLYRLYRFSESPLLGEPPLAEEWATESDVTQVNQEAIERGLIWVKSQD